MDATDGLDDEAKERLKRTITPAEAVQLRDLVQPLRCCDPAVGSGAFPVGLLHELVNLRRLLTTAANGYVDPVRGEGSTWLHETKADIVQNCLFGVDIQQQAIEICRLRLWLSMVVDYDLGLEPFTAEKSHFSHAIERISQLPNLEMNFHRGDSLHDNICGVPIVILPALGLGTHEGCPYAFLKTFKRVIDDETVPEDIPFAVPYDDLEKRKIKISPKVKSIRGKLNVPRERFHLRDRTTYLWAGL
jgi:hypothetical protein